VPTLEHGARYSTLEVRQIERAVRARLAEWDTALERESPQARAILSAALVGRLIFTAGEDQRGRFYEYVGRWSVGRTVAGLIHTMGVVTPAGSARLWRPEFQGLALVG
jgi:hypothetical protein